MVVLSAQHVNMPGTAGLALMDRIEFVWRAEHPDLVLARPRRLLSRPRQ